ncbi:TetR/AcrR family transcriptional regulator C-terminal domain-containing protein [Streptomyces sp. NPDC048428]|uniref:TetR/AcrR family transcriptional regulator C-terminal domain-containing protein n=1 Tax=Streptomyces sp. NPDC048428 TaxID=3154503 RepID=UPI00341A3F00
MGEQPEVRTAHAPTPPRTLRGPFAGRPAKTAATRPAPRTRRPAAAGTAARHSDEGDGDQGDCGATGDHSLAVYEAAGFAGARADQAAATVFTCVLGNAAGVAATASLTRKHHADRTSVEEQFQEAMAKAREIAMGYPRLRTRLETRAAAAYAAAPDETFEFGLRALLDGLERERAA